MKQQTVAIIIGALLIAGALAFPAYQHRYEVAGSVTGGLFVRLDTRTGQLSPCVLIERTTLTEDGVVARFVKRYSAAGFSEKEISDWIVAHAGQMVCSPSS